MALASTGLGSLIGRIVKATHESGGFNIGTLTGVEAGFIILDNHYQIRLSSLDSVVDCGTIRVSDN